MRSKFKKIGLFASFMVMFFIIVLLPLHHHDEKSENSNSSCSVCQLARSLQSAAPGHSVAALVLLEQGTAFTLPTFASPATFLLSSQSPRAPPLV